MSSACCLVSASLHLCISVRGFACVHIEYDPIRCHGSDHMRRFTWGILTAVLRCYERQGETKDKRTRGEYKESVSQEREQQMTV